MGKQKQLGVYLEKKKAGIKLSKGGKHHSSTIKKMVVKANVAADEVGKRYMPKGVLKGESDEPTQFSVLPVSLHGSSLKQIKKTVQRSIVHISIFLNFNLETNKQTTP